MKKGWKTAITILLVFMMGIAIISSTGNGSIIGDTISKSKLVKNVEAKYHRIINEVLNKKYME